MDYNENEIKRRLDRIEVLCENIEKASPLGGHISEEQLKRITGLSYQTIWRMRKKGILTAKCLGRTRFYNIDEIERAFVPAPLVEES